ncbi:MAG TPA: DUF6597 domain-containing transcriptional factor [Polyangiaceae bacterium]|nr:DUF6597 domain-containing transcriptional factor [Polyangiaceae bacterium]
MKTSGENTYQAKGDPGLQKPDTRVEHVRGVLHTPQGAEHGRIAAASDAVAEYVEHFWWARWCLAEPRSTEVLTYPSVHVTFEEGEERVVGVVPAKFVRRLVGEDWVFGIKFRPGMFRPLSRVPVHRLTDRVVPLGDELGGSGLGDAVRAQRSMDERAQVVELALRRKLPAPPTRALLARDLVERVRADSELRIIERRAADPTVCGRTSGTQSQGIHHWDRDERASLRHLVRPSAGRRRCRALRLAGHVLAGIADGHSHRRRARHSASEKPVENAGKLW